MSLNMSNSDLDDLFAMAGRITKGTGRFLVNETFIGNILDIIKEVISGNPAISSAVIHNDREHPELMPVINIVLVDKKAHIMIQSIPRSTLDETTAETTLVKFASTITELPQERLEKMTPEVTAVCGICVAMSLMQFYPTTSGKNISEVLEAPLIAAFGSVLRNVKIMITCASLKPNEDLQFYGITEGLVENDKLVINTKSITTAH